MLLYKVITHPAVVLASIAMIIVAGENGAGIFLQFFVMNLIALRIFAVIGAIGLIILFFSYMLLDRNKNPSQHHFLNALGMILIALSPVLFLYSLSWKNSYDTYTTIVPILSLSFATVCFAIYLVRNIRRIFRRDSYFSASQSA